MKNADEAVVEDFGLEWHKFTQGDLPPEELQRAFQSYFAIFPWQVLPAGAVGFDLGCGSGRWARLVAPRVGRLHCIDPSRAALEVARQNLQSLTNCELHCASVDSIPLADRTMDFGYSLGVLHHVPDTRKGIDDCVKKLKPGAPFLLYLYYAFDNRPWWFRALWRMSDFIRRGISSLPFRLKSVVCEIMAALVYWPLARIAKMAEKLGGNVSSFPLSAYRGRSFYWMRTDALDRFGTTLEQRFTQKQMRQMMEDAGLERISFGNEAFWCAVGYRSLQG